MRIIFMVFSFAVCVFASDVSQSFTVEGMHCGYGCANKIKGVVTSLEGVKKCEVDFSKSLMVVDFDDNKISPDQIITSVQDNTTYKASKMIKKKQNFWSKFKNMFSDKS